jgi:hypothetical protein
VRAIWFWSALWLRHVATPRADNRHCPLTLLLGGVVNEDLDLLDVLLRELEKTLQDRKVRGVKGTRELAFTGFVLVTALKDNAAEIAT